MRNILLIFFSIIILSFVSCGGKTKEVGTENDSTTLTIGLLPTYDCIPFYYAQQEGVFDSLGIEVRFITYESSMDADTAFVNGCVHGVVSDLIKAAIWRSNGDSVKVVMGMNPEISLVTAKASRLFKMQNIKERIIALTRHSILDFTADKMLETVKMKSEDINKPQINNLMLRTKMTDQNQYDGAFLPEPYTTEATKVWGAKLLKNSSSLGIDYLGSLIFNDSTLQSRNEEIKLLITGYSIAVDKLNKAKQYPLHYLPKENLLEIPDTLFEYKDISSPKLPSDSVLQLVNKWAMGRGIVKTPATYKSLIDSTLIKQTEK